MLNFNESSLPLVEHRETVYGEYYRAGEWSFDLAEDGNPEHALDAAKAWLAWYLHLTHRNAKEARK